MCLARSLPLAALCLEPELAGRELVLDDLDAVLAGRLEAHSARNRDLQLALLGVELLLARELDAVEADRGVRVEARPGDDEDALALPVDGLGDIRPVGRLRRERGGGKNDGDCGRRGGAN